jgi:glycine/D-amino acid oxidase-like deaminating enzyme
LILTNISCGFNAGILNSYNLNPILGPSKTAVLHFFGYDIYQVVTDNNKEKITFNWYGNITLTLHLCRNALIDMKHALNADIVIIGAGTLGSSTAYYLSKHTGKRVVVVEKNTIGSGATSWAAALINRVRTKAEQIPMVLETYNAIVDLENELNTSLGYRKVGCLHIAASSQTQEIVEEIIDLAKTFDIEGERLTPEEVLKWFPWMNGAPIHNAFYMPDDVYIDGYMLASAYARAARNYGAKFMQRKKVHQILVERDKITGIQLEEGATIETPIVILAAGAWSNMLSFPLGIALPLAPVRSIYWLTSSNPDLFPAEMPMTFIPDAMVYLRPESGALLFGIRDRESLSFDPNKLPEAYDNYQFINDEDQWNLLLNETAGFQQFFPALYDTPISRCISGLSTYTADGKLVIGPSESITGFYAASGCMGAGVALSGGYGRLLMEIINGEKPFIDPSPFLPSRLGFLNPFSMDFMKRCSATRTGKKDGG